MSYRHAQLFIDGQWCDAASGQSLAVLNPATGREIGRVAHAGIAALMRERAADIGALMTMEQGKRLAESKAEAAMSAEVIEWFAEEGRRVYGRVVPSRSLAVQQTVLRRRSGRWRPSHRGTSRSTRWCASCRRRWPPAAR
jgi:succinate-semialdehyde dehydrogenase/glutarate-semialdehyde dehydrogenase